jgi:FlaA1/EpsC-like NDP-sugar epimerase
MEILIYGANILYLLSYLVRDILHLRLLTIVAACSLVTYFYSQAEPLMTVVYWNLFFVTLNVLQLTRILWERYRTRANVQHQTAESAVYATWSI